MSPRYRDRQRDRDKLLHSLWLRGIKALNVVLMSASFALCWQLYYAQRIVLPFSQRGNWAVIGLFTALYFVFARLYGGFMVSLARISELVYSQSLAVVFTDAIMYFVIFLLARNFLSILPLLALLVGQALLAALWSVAAHKSYFARFAPLRTLVIWDLHKGVDELLRSDWLNRRFQVASVVHIEKCEGQLAEVMDGIDAAFLCGVHSHERNQIVKFCVQHNIRVYVIPSIGDELMQASKPVHILHLPMVTLERYNPAPEYVAIKRLFDIVASGAALILLSPLMLVVALLIRRDGGTVFYKQKRLTKDRKEFYVIKFRSMRMDAEKDGVARLSAGDSDDRITPIGRFIRACRIDELPQLINILKGEMSIVGPRPERPEIAAKYEAELPEFALRLQAKAGLTGYAQVYGKYNTTPYDKLLMDLHYIAHPSLAEDLRIIFATVMVLFEKESTEGFSEGQTAVEAERKEAELGKTRQQSAVG